MGHIVVEAKLTNPITNESVTITALVDTGATFTVIPTPLAEKLKLPHVVRRRVVTAGGVEELPESYVMVEVVDEKTVTPVLISDKLDRVLLGVLTLEALALKVDPRTGRLEKAELLLL